jgi:regulator of protease activity HflC (stomatin/prohibitin superfamily)
VTYTWDKMNSYSYDQQPADLKISVTLRAAPEKVADLYARFGTLDAAVNQVVSPVVNQQVKIVFGHYTAVKAIQERGSLNTEIKSAISDSLKYDPMIVIDAVQLENIEFSQNYLHSIEQRMLAEVEVQKLQQNAEREKVQAQITVTQATAKANAIRAEAQANADATRLSGEARAANIKVTGDAEASAIEARGKALASNPNLVTLVQAERWNGVLPTTMVPGSTVPFVSIK